MLIRPTIIILHDERKPIKEKTNELIVTGKKNRKKKITVFSTDICSYTFYFEVSRFFHYLL